MLDTIIIGGGPAGLAAAVYLARQKIQFAMLTKEVGGMTLWSSDVENYLGFHLLDGVELVKRFREHLNDYKTSFTLKEGELVQSVEKTGEFAFKVTTDKDTYETRTILIVTGEKPRQLNVPGERELFGHGVTYCANCDAPLFGGKDVTVIGGGNSAMDAALFLEKYATAITIVTVNDTLMGDAMLRKRCEKSERITILTNRKTTSIQGTTLVTGIELEDAQGKRTVRPTQGVFIEVGLMPSAQFIDIVKKNNQGEIMVDQFNQTSVPGIWAAGDVTDITQKQIAVAVGEGSKAALQVIKWLSTHPLR